MPFKSWLKTRRDRVRCPNPVPLVVRIQALISHLVHATGSSLTEWWDVLETTVGPQIVRASVEGEADWRKVPLEDLLVVTYLGDDVRSEVRVETEANFSNNFVAIVVLDWKTEETADVRVL